MAACGAQEWRDLQWDFSELRYLDESLPSRCRLHFQGNLAPIPKDLPPQCPSESIHILLHICVGTTPHIILHVVHLRTVFLFACLSPYLNSISALQGQLPCKSFVHCQLALMLICSLLFRMVTNSGRFPNATSGVLPRHVLPIRRTSTSGADEALA